MSKVIGLFPTPVMKVDGFLDAEAVDSFTRYAESLERQTNSSTDLLSHTQIMDPAHDPHYAKLAELAAPHLEVYGELLLAKRARWTVKEAWLNVLQQGGSQFMHSHANSFASGIVYITKPHDSANTVFRKSTGGGEFVFKNDVPLDHYSSDTWIVGDIQPGDLLLYPSYLMHGVPPNEGERRITLAFNSIPDQLDSLGYKISFGV